MKASRTVRWIGAGLCANLGAASGAYPASAAQEHTPVVVSYERRAERAPQQWTIDPTPRLVIGEVDGPEEYLLTNPLAAIRQSDGTIVIRDSNRDYFNLRYYDSTGSHVATASRFGQGPFEFRYPIGVHGLPSDSVLVFGEDGRFAVFGPRGEAIREGRFDLGEVLPLPPLSSRLVDATRFAFGTSGGSGLPPTGVHRGEIVVLLWDSEAAVLDTVSVVLSSPSYYERMTDRRGVYIYSYPFTPETSIVAGNGRIWIGQADVGEVRGYDATGELDVVIQFLDDPDDVGWWDRRRFRSEMLDGLSGETERRFARYARSMEFPDRYPHFARLEVDSRGRLWVKRYEVPWSDGAQSWDVLGRDGEWIATVSVPATLVPDCARSTRRRPCDRIREIGDDYVLVDVGAPRDVRRVAKFGLSKAH